MVTSDFLLSGRAVFTVTEPSGELHKFSVERLPPTDVFPRPTYVAKMAVGWQDGERMVMLGTVSEHIGQVCLTAKTFHSFKNDRRLFLLNRVLLRVWGGEQDMIAAAGFDLAPVAAKRCRVRRLVKVAA